MELWLLRQLELHRHQLPVRLTRVHAGPPHTLLGPKLEAGVIHAERPENMVPKVFLERLAARRLDGFAYEINVDPVSPPAPRLACERHQRGLVLAADDAGDARMFHVAAYVGVP